MTVKVKKVSQSAQARWQRRMKRQGKCRVCGKKRSPNSKSLCALHRQMTNQYMRQYRKRIRDAKAEGATVVTIAKPKKLKGKGKRKAKVTIKARKVEKVEKVENVKEGAA